MQSNSSKPSKTNIHQTLKQLIPLAKFILWKEACDEAPWRLTPVHLIQIQRSANVCQQDPWTSSPFRFMLQTQILIMGRDKKDGA
ncbi:hypothetical protein CEXT_480971 [Caerostris extrusa]|uniref:Uncharacterized protein n=1 Tax=Caerostris extrusa TaxID=172846 RepID=A0AAV4R8S6_CAEEX|nr:hypothetical protein CEXT_480971 [Caerostris extrusa]